MPCYSDYMDPMWWEVELHECAMLRVYVDKYLHTKSPTRLLEASKHGCGSPLKLVDLEPLVVELCATLNSLTPKQRNHLIYNARDAMSRRLADWWERHQLADRERKRREATKRRCETLAKRAREKLSPAELEALLTR